jgi:hypothetical protein
VVPDIYKKAEIKEGRIALATDLKVGERVRLVTKTGENVSEVTESSEAGFKTREQPESGEVFVYGREVNDFRTVDYDAISMLNVSATQQLKKEKDAEVKSLQSENGELRSKLSEQEKRLAELEAKDKAREAKLAAIEKALLDGGGSAATERTVSLKKARSVK